jgi:hypothetical protein
LSRAKPGIGEMDAESAIVAKLDEVRKDRAAAFKSRNAWTAVSTLHRLEADLLERLAEVRAPKVDENAPSPVADKSDPALVAMVSDLVRDLPDEALDALDAAVALRRTGRPALRVVE